MQHFSRKLVAMEFPILTLLPLPLPAIRLVTQYLRQPHPTALLIKPLKFLRHDAQDSCDDGDEDEFGYEPRIFASLTVHGRGIRIKDLSTPWPHSYVVRHRITPFNTWNEAYTRRFNLWFSYDDITGEPNHEIEDDDESYQSDQSWEGELDDVWYSG